MSWNPSELLQFTFCVRLSQCAYIDVEALLTSATILRNYVKGGATIDVCVHFEIAIEQLLHQVAYDINVTESSGKAVDI